MSQFVCFSSSRSPIGAVALSSSCPRHALFPEQFGCLSFLLATSHSGLSAVGIVGVKFGSPSCLPHLNWFCSGLQNVPERIIMGWSWSVPDVVPMLSWRLRTARNVTVTKFSMQKHATEPLEPTVNFAVTASKPTGKNIKI